MRQRVKDASFLVMIGTMPKDGINWTITGAFSVANMWTEGGVFMYWVELPRGVWKDFPTYADAVEYCIVNGIHCENIYED